MPEGSLPVMPEPVLIHINSDIQMPNNRIGQLDNKTLRNELIIAHAQIEVLHKIISLLSGCMACESDEDFNERCEHANSVIDDYEETFNMIVEFEL